jgi:hypothetical protein
MWMDGCVRNTPQSPSGACPCLHALSCGQVALALHGCSARLGFQGVASGHSDADIGREGVALSVGCFQGQDVAPGLFGFVAQAPIQNFQSPEIVMLGLVAQADGQVFAKVRFGWQSRRA